MGRSMLGTALALAFLAGPFWEAAPPQEWTEEGLHRLMHDSPWAQVEGAQVFLASATPIKEAEAELRRRNPPTGAQLEDPLADDYRDFMRENPGNYIVLAVLLPRTDFLAEEKQTRKMESYCTLKVGEKKHQMVGHFPPTTGDPYLRLVFPRAVQPTDKRLLFDLYLPGIPKPFRRVIFDVKDMFYKGKLEL